MRSSSLLPSIILAIIVFPRLIGCAEAAATYGPLHEAARAGNAEVVRSWIREKRNLDEKYNDRSFSLESNYSRVRGLTALMVAAESGQAEIAKLLIDGGADIYAESRWANGSNPLNAFDYAVKNGHLAVAAPLWAKSDKVRFARALNHQFANACSLYCDEQYGSNEATNLALFIAKIITNEETLGDGIGWVACWPQALPRLKFLAEHGVHFPKNTLGCVAGAEAGLNSLVTPQARVEIAQFLLAQGADPNALPRDTDAYTPLMMAASSHDLDMLTFLLSHGADPNMQNRQGYTAIMTAANTCSHAPPTSGSNDLATVEKRQKIQLAVIEQLGSAGARAANSPKTALLSQCCATQPHTETQERICRVFAKNPN
jgi:ankyrin repeat protein